MLTNYHPKGKPISASTRNTYYQIFNGALNAAVRAKRILKNPFNEMEKSEKPKMPESVRSYMTIEEVRSLIATPMQNEGVKVPTCSPASVDYVSVTLSDCNGKMCLLTTANTAWQ